MADEVRPEILFDSFFAYLRTGVLKAAIEHDVFTHIASGQDTADAIAAAAHADPRAMRIVLDTLCVFGFLGKDARGRYVLTPLAEAMLVRGGPAFAGDFMRITGNRWLWNAVGALTEIVRTGKPPEAMVETPGHEFWIEFAQASEQMSSVGASMMSGLLDLDPAKPIEVLDVACGSGVYGFAVLDAVPGARVTALDWPEVLAKAKVIAERRGLAERMSWLPGSVFEVPLPEKRFDLVLASHFYHHFSPDKNVELSRRLFGALKPGGMLAIQDWVANEERTGPTQAVMFAVVMLASTLAGDVYTLGQYRSILAQAGFPEVTARELPMLGAQLLCARRPG